MSAPTTFVRVVSAAGEELRLPARTRWVFSGTPREALEHAVGHAECMGRVACGHAECMGRVACGPTDFAGVDLLGAMKEWGAEPPHPSARLSEIVAFRRRFFDSRR